MATQYIGARYVPVFADPAEWSSENSYEPLTIVLHNGNSYTSAQYVPIGIDIENDSYWKLTGNFNSQVEQYRSEVKTFDARITTADTTANDALSLAQTNEKDIAALDSEMAGISDSGLKTLIANNADSIVAETARATAAEKTNADNLNNEITRATNAENNIKSDNGSIDVYIPVNAGGISNSANIVVTDKVGLIDCGANMTVPTINQLNALGITKLDYIVFTHMHADHVDKTGSLVLLKDFIDSNTPIYIQMEPASSFAEYDVYSAGLTVINSLGGNVIVPTDNATVNFGDTNVTFYNTNSSNIESYSTYSELNIFSLVAKVQYANNTYVNCGDIYWTAQNKYTNIGNCDLFVWPHHCTNRWDSYKFINQFGCNNIYRNAPTDGKSIYILSPRNYFVRWLNQHKNVIFYDTVTDAGDVNAHFKIKSGHVNNISGTRIYKLPNLQFIDCYFDVDANKSDNIDEYKSWDLPTMQQHMTSLPAGMSVYFEITRTDTQFALDMLALLMSANRASYNTFKSININATKIQYGANVGFIYEFEGWLPFKMLIMNRLTEIFTFPTYSDATDVENRYYVQNVTDVKKKSVIGEIYDGNNNTYSWLMPRVCHEAPIKLVFGSYYVGMQNYNDFNKTEIFNGSRDKCTYLTFRIRFNETVGDFPAENIQDIITSTSTGSYTMSKYTYGHNYQFMVNNTHLVIARDSETIYDSANDTAGDKVSFISVW